MAKQRHSWIHEKTKKPKKTLFTDTIFHVNSTVVGGTKDHMTKMLNAKDQMQSLKWNKVQDQISFQSCGGTAAVQVYIYKKKEQNE